MNKLLALLGPFICLVSWGQSTIFRQDFSTSSSVGDYASETPGNGQFHLISASSVSGLPSPDNESRVGGALGDAQMEISSGKLKMNGYSAWCIYRTSQGFYSINADRSSFRMLVEFGERTAVQYSFDFAKLMTPGYNNGESFSRLDIPYFPYAIDLSQGLNSFRAGGQTFSGEHKISVIVNTSETAVSFSLPGGSFSLNPGYRALFVDDLMIEAYISDDPLARPTRFDIRFGTDQYAWTNIPYYANPDPVMSNYTFTLDNFLIEDYSPFAAAKGPEELNYILGIMHAVETVDGRYRYTREVASPTYPGQTETLEVYYDGTQWVWRLHKPDPSSRTSGAIVLATNPSQSAPNAPCSGWTNGFSLEGSGCNTALPVTLTTFTGQITDGSEAHLQWATTSETNSYRFDVEHSSDARDWRRVGSVDARGESNKLVNYAYIHTHPIKGNNYYRLVQTDRDGTFTYSRIISLRLAGALAVYPNPATDRVYVGDPENLKGVEVTDAQGRVAVRQTRGLAEGILLKGLSPGLFFLTTEDILGRKQTVKFLLQP